MYISYLVYPFIPNGHLLLSFLMTVNSAAMNKYLFETLLALLLDTYPEVELLDHMMILL